MDLRQGVALALGTLLVVGALVASAAGWFGDVIVCGADRAPGCVTWPTPVSAVVWSAFITGVTALVVWQLRLRD